MSRRKSSTPIGCSTTTVMASRVRLTKYSISARGRGRSQFFFGRNSQIQPASIRIIVYSRFKASPKGTHALPSPNQFSSFCLLHGEVNLLRDKFLGHHYHKLISSKAFRVVLLTNYCSLFHANAQGHQLAQHAPERLPHSLRKKDGKKGHNPECYTAVIVETP